MKNFNKYFLAAVIVVSIFTGCKKESFQNDSIIEVPSVTGTWSYTLPADMTEADSTFLITLTLDKAQVVDIHVPISAGDGTAAEDADFALSDHAIVIPAGSTSGKVKLNIYTDAEIEEDETVVVNLGDESVANAAIPIQSVNLILHNYVAPYLDLSFDWSGTATVDTVNVVDLCDVDLDVLVFDVDGNDLGIYGAATGNCPEQLSTDGWDDGDYYLKANLWDNSVVHPTNGEIIGFPIRIGIVQAGAFDEVLPQNPNNIINSSEPDAANDGGDTTKGLIRITKTGNSYTYELL